jgi:hypothetical protein
VLRRCVFDTSRCTPRAYILDATKNLRTPSDFASMAHPDRPFQILFVSRIAVGCDFGIIRNIVLAARERNPAFGITGALLFDGERFCELIEGAEADVRLLMERITRDSRHTDVTVLFAGPAPAGRVAQGWVSGYCDASALDAFGAEGELRDRTALDAFTSVLAGADVA